MTGSQYIVRHRVSVRELATSGPRMWQFTCVFHGPIPPLFGEAVTLAAARTHLRMRHGIVEATIPVYRIGGEVVLS